MTHNEIIYRPTLNSISQTNKNYNLVLDTLIKSFQSFSLKRVEIRKKLTYCKTRIIVQLSLASVTFSFTFHLIPVRKSRLYLEKNRYIKVYLKKFVEYNLKKHLWIKKFAQIIIHKQYCRLA